MTDLIRPDASHTGRGRGRSPQSAADMLGAGRHGELTLIGELPSRAIERADGRRFVRLGEFACSCGTRTTAELRNVKRGLTRSCGCLSTVTRREGAGQ